MCSAPLPDPAPDAAHDHDHDHDAGEVVWPSREPLPEWTPDWRLSQWPRTGLLALIRLYQVTLSRALPANTCRFYPSCSRYGFQAIQKYGAVRGGLMAFWRVMRCNPFNPGGFDPVP